MSGTSADGIDLALVDFTGTAPKLVAKYYQAYDQETHQQITALYRPSSNEIERAFSLDVLLAKQFAQAINHFIQQQHLTANDIVAIGNHGQTIRHRPLLVNDNKNKNAHTTPAPFTLQISCNQTLSTLTNIRVIGDFRRKDMVLGGQGAPLVPAFHQALFPHDQDDTFVVNIGGISNITFLPKTASDKRIIGFDTGPGNALMDDWFQQHHQGRFDRDGAWAAQGKVNQALLNHFLDDPYFSLPAPKSTGREIYHLDWLLTKIKGFDVSAVDIQATLAVFTAQTIVDDIHKISQQGKVFLCGGGVLNSNLYQLIYQQLNHFTLADTNQINIDSDALEAMAFAWFAYAFDQKICGNIPAVTGASKATVLGVCYTP
jgi:anhydro-N-acetylmuramic acid kinase